MTLTVLTYLFTFSSCWISVVRGEKPGDSDKILYLPGVWPPPNFTQYSGYLNGVSDKIQIHYWLVEAETKPESAPLILWLNGGPGCSSLEGLLSENGPYMLVKGPSLVNNPYSWNKLGNVLYLESPAGVGFSYSLDGNVTTDDDETALNNHHALLHFLDKFPEYEGRKLYVTGESYGGVYVPTLALLLKDSPRFKLRGIAVGNGLTSYKLNDNSFLYYIRYHGFIGGSSWNDLLAKCCADQCSTWWCAFTDNKTRECQRIISQLAEGPLKGINRYNIYSKCAGGVDRLFQQSMPSRRSVGENSSTRQPSNPYIRHDFGDMFRDNHYMKFLRDLKSALRRNLTTRLTVACVDDTLIRSYLNSPVVRRLINVKPDVPKEWDICSDEVNGKYIRTYDDLSEQYMKLLQSRISTLIYNGDIDVAFNYLGGEMFVDNLKLKPTLSRRFWLYTESDGTKQIGGYWKMFESHGSILTYATVRGAGHKVPADKPAAAFQLINTFINEGSSVERKSKKIHLISLLCVISFFISSL